MELANILENKEPLIYGLMGNSTISTNHEDYYIVSEYKFSGNVEDFLNSKKASASLKMVMLNDEYLEKDSSSLSDIEIKKVILAKALIENKKVIILNYFDKGLNNREKEEFKRLFKKLSQDYKKIILLFTNDITFIWDIASSIFFIEDNNIKEFTKKEYFDLVKIIDSPSISEIISHIRKKNIKIEDYKNISDLLKAIYRLKENES